MKKRKAPVSRRACREQLEQKRLGCELVRVVRRFFPGLLPSLKTITDKRHPSYIKYGNHVLLMTRILSAIFYISSMRKTSEEFNTEKVIKNIGYVCGENLSEVPYWETINQYLKTVPTEELQRVIHELVRELVRSRAFEDARIHGKYWQVIVDGTQLTSSRRKLDGECLYRVYNRGTEKEYTEYYYYVLEAKLYLHKNIYVSIMTEFVENSDSEAEKQDCEIKAAKRLMERMKERFPMLPICISADSLYACESMVEMCKNYHWAYMIRYKKGSIPSIYEEYQSLRQLEHNYREYQTEGLRCWYDHVNGIEYRGHLVNVLEYGDSEGKAFCFLTNLPITEKNRKDLLEDGRRRWGIENQGFNTQKRQGYALEHLFSRNYQAVKNHYLLIQIGHMISQILESWEKLWKKIKQSRQQKHRRLLESWKNDLLAEHFTEDKGYQIRLS